MQRSNDRTFEHNRFSRILAALLSLALAVSLCPLPSYADEGEGASATLEGAVGDQGGSGSVPDAPSEADSAETGTDPDDGRGSDVLPDAQSDETVAEETDLRVLGDPNGAWYSLEAVNALGCEIEGVEAKASASDAWNALSIEGDLPWAEDEAVQLCLPDLRDSVDPVMLEQVGSDSLYDLRLNASGTLYELHAVCFDDVESVRICWDAQNGIPFLEMGYPDGSVSSTLGAEIALRDGDPAQGVQAETQNEASVQSEDVDNGEAGASGDEPVSEGGEQDSAASAEDNSSDEGGQDDAAVSGDEDVSAERSGIRAADGHRRLPGGDRLR